MAAEPARAASVDAAPRDRELARRLRRLGVTGRRMRRGWTRERTIEVLRTLAWTIPLTLLLWIWAQEQQLEEQVVGGVRVRLSHEEADRFVRRIAPPGSGPSRADAPLDVTLTLRGPRAGLQAAARELRDPSSPGLEMRLNLASAPRTSLDLRQNLVNVDVLERNGVALAEVSPASIEISVEGIDNRRVPVLPSATGLPASERVGEVGFEPPDVTLYAPERVLEAVRRFQARGEAIVSATLPEDVPAGPQTLPVPVELNPALRDDIEAEYGATALDRLRLEPLEVKASFTRRDREIAQFELPAVAISFRKPAAMEANGSVTVVELTGESIVNNVRVRGPKSVIDRLRNNPDFAAEVRAILPIEPADKFALGQVIERQLVFELPPDVELESEAPTVTFSLESLFR